MTPFMCEQNDVSIVLDLSAYIRVVEMHCPPVDIIGHYILLSRHDNAFPSLLHRH